MIPSFRWVFLKLVAFTVVTVVVTVWLASSIGNFRLFAEPYELEASFTDATGLLRGDVVKAAGVTIGRVDAISVDRGIAVVTMSIDEDSILPDNLGAEVRYRNLIGQRMITLVPAAGIDAEGDFEHGDEIPLARTKAAFDLSVLFNGLRPLIRSTDADDINLVAREITAALAGREDEVEGFLANVSTISDMVASKDAELTRLLHGVNTVTEDLAGRDAQLRRTLASFSNFLGDLRRSRGKLDAALVTLDDAAGKIQKLIERNDENISASIDNLTVLLDAVNDRRDDLRGAVDALPAFLAGIERVTSYGQWQNVHLIHACKDDKGTCGTRGSP